MFNWELTWLSYYRHVYSAFSEIVQRMDVITDAFALFFFRKNPDLYGALAKGQSPKVGWPLFSFLL